MYYLIDFCCICINNKEYLQPLSDSDSDNITYFNKLTSCFSEMHFNEMKDHWLICNQCCETMDAAYEFHLRCLRSKTMLTNYISQLKEASNMSSITNIYLTDINKFGYVEKEYQKEKTEMFIKVNEKENFVVKPITEIKREDNPSTSKIIDTEHIQFENVVIDMKREDQFFEEVEESVLNSLVNHDEIGVSQNDILLTTSAIKKENEDKDFGEHLHERFDNNLKTCNSENDDVALKVEKHNYFPLYSEKCSDNHPTNLDEIKIDIVDNIESANDEINIQYKTENIEEFSRDDNFIPLEEDRTDKETISFHKSLKAKQEKNCGGVNRKLNIVKKHECNICRKKFLYSSYLIIHMRIHTREKSHECSVCQKKFNQSVQLREHLKIHTKEKSHKCDICQKKFTRPSNLKKHMSIHAVEKSHECDICQKNFNQLSILLRHKRTHSGEKPHKCDVCEKNFAQLYNLREHMRIHAGEKSHECSVCQKKFIQLSNLRQHMRIHTGEKPHECNVCQKKFIQSSNLRKHMRIHTGEKPHECSVCQKKFTHLSTLQDHMKIHTGEKSHECSVCQKKFARLSNLREHIKIHTAHEMSQGN